MSALVVSLYAAVLVGSAFIYEFQHSAHDFIEFFFGEFAVFNRFDDVLVGKSARIGHFQVKPRLYALNAVVRGVPVAYHNSLESPFVAQNIGKKTLVVGSVFAVHAVVRTHYRPRLGFLHRAFECGHIYLAQGAFVHDRVYGHAARFLVVCAKMLYGNAHVMLLHAADVAYAHTRRKIGVFAQIFEIASAKRRTLDIHAGTQDNRNVLVEALNGYLFTHLSRNGNVPRACKSYGGGKRRRGIRFVHRLVVVLHLQSETVGTVRHTHGGYAQPCDGFCRPVVASAAQPRLFFQGKFGNQLVDINFAVHSTLRRIVYLT